MNKAITLYETQGGEIHCVDPTSERHISDVKSMITTIIDDNLWELIMNGEYKEAMKEMRCLFNNIMK